MPGYRVWTPLRLADGAWLVVDRGWVAAHPDRRRLPEIAVGAEPREVSGFWRPLPRPGLRLATDRPVRAGAEPETDWHSVVCWGQVAEFANVILVRGDSPFNSIQDLVDQHLTPPRWCRARQCPTCT